MASITLTSGNTSRSIELLDEVNDADAVNVHIGSKYAELTTDSSLVGDTPRLKFSKNGVDYWIRESFMPMLPSGRGIYRHSSGKGSVLVYPDGQEILVLDAQYRRKNKTWYEAMDYCESIIIDGQACDCPTADHLYDIRADMDGIDANDPSLPEYEEFALANWGFGSVGSDTTAGTYVWTNYAYSGEKAKVWDYDWRNVEYKMRASLMGVVPYCEL